MDVGVADAACMHLHEHLIRAGLRLRNVFDLPRTAHSGNDRSLHKFPPSPIRCKRLCGRCMFLDVRFAHHTPKLRLTVGWRIVGKPYLRITSGLPVTRPERSLFFDSGSDPEKARFRTERSKTKLQPTSWKRYAEKIPSHRHARESIDLLCRAGAVELAQHRRRRKLSDLRFRLETFWRHVRPHASFAQWQNIRSPGAPGLWVRWQSEVNRFRVSRPVHLHVIEAESSTGDDLDSRILVNRQSHSAGSLSSGNLCNQPVAIGRDAGKTSNRLIEHLL